MLGVVSMMHAALQVEIAMAGSREVYAYGCVEGSRDSSRDSEEAYDL